MCIRDRYQRRVHGARCVTIYRMNTFIRLAVQVALQSRVNTRLYLQQHQRKGGVNIVLEFVIVALAIGISGFLGYYVRKKIAEAKISSAEEAAKKIVEEAQKIAEAKKKRNFDRSKRRNSQIAE
eukprot:TRINITY_DN3210_c0_g2_i4.p2 TRINITY_DN3210_c0_g2~~TRINITY_DN3210_c0_g2_i4.p2  ORF type:complete len:124 (-),score=22.90 TRINITY_DN3210_c0_g2_i4:110-481(-)